jgi:hypothetical protein
MPLVLLMALAFVTAGLYVRRHYGGAALAALWLGASTIMTAADSAALAVALAGLGKPMPNAGRALMTALMFYIMATSFGGSALAIEWRRRADGPWLTAQGLIVGVIGFMFAGALAVALLVILIVLYVAPMAH